MYTMHEITTYRRIVVVTTSEVDGGYGDTRGRLALVKNSRDRFRCRRRAQKPSSTKASTACEVMAEGKKEITNVLVQRAQLSSPSARCR